MASFKVAVVFLFAFGALECQTAGAVPEPKPRDVNVFLAAQNAIAIVRNVIGAIDKGIEDSKPNLDVIIQQLTPELGKAVRGLLDEVRGLLREERERVEFMIKEVEQVLDALKTIKSCTDQERKNVEKVLGNLENGLLDAYKKTKTSQAKQLQDMVTGFKRIVNNLRKLFDSEANAVTECFRPGNPNLKKCLENEIENIKKAVIGIAADAFFFSGEVKEVITQFASELTNRGKPVVERFFKDNDVVVKKISDCVAKLK